MSQNDEKHNKCSENLKMMFTSHKNTTNLCVIQMMWLGKYQSIILGKDENGRHHIESTLKFLELEQRLLKQ